MKGNLHTQFSLQYFCSWALFLQWQLFRASVSINVIKTSFFSSVLLRWQFYIGLWEWWEVLNIWWSHQPPAANFLSRYDSEGVLQEARTGLWKKKMLVWFHHNLSLPQHLYFFNTMLQVGAISEAFENFQFRTYGIKAQVHATPEKKKNAKVVLWLRKNFLQLQRSQIQYSSIIITPSIVMLCLTYQCYSWCKNNFYVTYKKVMPFHNRDNSPFIEIKFVHP